MAKILIVEDEPQIVRALRLYLERAGYSAVAVHDGAQAIPAFRQEKPDLILLDLNLPNRDGVDICRAIRRDSGVPIIMVTARSEEMDRLIGLEIGADDYVVKPFSPRELVARVRAVLRRVEPEEDRDENVTTVGPFQLKVDHHKILYQGESLELSRYEFRLLRILLERPGRVFSRDELMGLAWEEPDMSLQRTVDTHIKTLRQKLKSISDDEEAIITHRGVGYSLKEYP